jgi:hypothetical protein
METEPEALWTESLPGQRQRLRAAFSVLNEKESRNALGHLQRMASELGWADASRRNALAALEGRVLVHLRLG